MLDKKIKISKSIYAAETLEKDFEKILSYKKIISNKKSLYFDSPKNAKTDVEFYSNKKSSDGGILPKLFKAEYINPKIKTTSTNFFKNSNLEKNDKFTKLLEIKSSGDSIDNNALIAQNLLISSKTNSNNDSSFIVNNKLKMYLFPQHTFNNFRNSNDEILDKVYIDNNSK